MIIALLAVTVAWTAWCVWAEKNPPRHAEPPTAKPEPTPVAVELDEKTDSVEDKRRMLDRIFAQHSTNDDDVDPPTVVADRR